jgi:hypothetical protein
MWVLVPPSTSCHFASYRGAFVGMDTEQRAVEFLDHVAERRF